MSIADQIHENQKAYITKTGNEYPDVMYLGRSEMNALKAYLHTYVSADMLVDGGGLADKRIVYSGMTVIPCAIASHIGFSNNYND